MDLARDYATHPSRPASDFVDYYADDPFKSITRELDRRIVARGGRSLFGIPWPAIVLVSPRDSDAYPGYTVARMTGPKGL